MVGKVHTIRPRVQTGAQIEDCRGFLRDRIFDERVNDAGPHGDQPLANQRPLCSISNDFFAVKTRKPGCQLIAEESVGAPGFDGPIGGDHESRVGNVLDLARLHRSSHIPKRRLILPGIPHVFIKGLATGF